MLINPTTAGGPSISTLHPDGWIGDKAELHRARRYRALTRWAQIPLWAAFLASWFIPFLADMVLTGFVFAGWGVQFIYQKRISLAIRRKWTLSQELKEVWLNRKSTTLPTSSATGLDKSSDGSVTVPEARRSVAMTS